MASGPIDWSAVDWDSKKKWRESLFESWPRQSGKSYFMEQMMGNYSRDSLHPLLSQPIPVHAAGWKSDTVTLQKNGWTFFANYEPHSMKIMLALEWKHPVNAKTHAMGLSMSQRIDEYRINSLSGGILRQQVPPFIIDEMGPEVVMQHERWSERYTRKQFRQVNMEPTSRMMWQDEVYTPHEPEFRYVHEEQGMPLEMLLFRPEDRHLQHDTPDILIKEQSVDELLNIIKDQFADSDEEYYEQQMNEKDQLIITDKKVISNHLHLVSVRK